MQRVLTAQVHHLGHHAPARLSAEGVVALDLDAAAAAEALAEGAGAHADVGALAGAEGAGEVDVQGQMLCQQSTPLPQLQAAELASSSATTIGPPGGPTWK